MNKLLAGLTQRVLWPIWLLLLIVILFDFRYRLVHHLSDEENDWKIESNPLVFEPGLSQEKALLITKILSKYDLEKDEQGTVKSSTLSDQEQVAQQGLISQLYSGDLRFRLVGIFTRNDDFAVISGKDFASNTDKVIKVKVGEKLGDYMITTILANEIQLVADDKRQVTLKLFKSNY